MKKKNSNNEFYLQIAIIGVLLIMIAYNAGKIYYGNLPTRIKTVSAAEVIPKGVPKAYGESLGVSYDDISPSNQKKADETIRKLSKYENLELNEEEMKRYIRIGTSISCEYCCGAKAIIFENGQRACGCAHSYAMRGLAKYLIRNFKEMSDEKILNELGKWKVLFFPGIHVKKAEVLKSKGIDPQDYINLASNKYRGIEKGQSYPNEMVGGC